MNYSETPASIHIGLGITDERMEEIDAVIDQICGEREGPKGFTLGEAVLELAPHLHTTEEGFYAAFEFRSRLVKNWDDGSN